MIARLLTALTLGSLFLTLNIASSGCVGGASLNPSQLPGGLGVSGAGGDGASGSDKNKNDSDSDSDSDGNGGSGNGLPGLPSTGGAAGTAGAGGGDGGGGGGGGDDNVAKGTANFQPFETGMGEDKEPKPHENAQNEEQDPAENEGETLQNQGCEPNCSAEVPYQQYLIRPLDYNNHISNISPVLIAPVVNGNLNIR